LISGVFDPLMVACIPALVEERRIDRVVVRARRYVDRIVVCEDGSTASTSEVSRCLGVGAICELS
jgi:hypothetical protein